MREDTNLTCSPRVGAKPTEAAGAGSNRRRMQLAAHKAAAHVFDSNFQSRLLLMLRRRGGAVSKSLLLNYRQEFI